MCWRMCRLSLRSAFFLCFLLIHHDVIIATTYHDVHHRHAKRSKANNEVVYDSRGPIYIGHDFTAFHDEEQIDNNLYSRSSVSASNRANLTKSVQKTEGGHRRLFGLILLLVSLVTTFASVGLDAYVSIKGCAGLYPSLKTFEDQFEAKKRDLERRADVIDKAQEEARLMKQRVEDASDAMGGAWEQIERISRLQQQILTALDPDIIVAMNNISTEIEQEVRATKNAAQEWSVEKIDGKYKGIFSSATTIVGTFGPALVSVMGPIAKVSFKYYKLSKIASTLKATNLKQILQAAPKAKTLLGFTDDVIKANLKATNALRIASRSSGALKALKFLKGAGAVLSIVGIGVDIFSIVSTILECKNKRDRAKESLEKLKEAEKEAIVAEKEVESYREEVNKFWRDDIAPKIRSESLKQALRGIKELVQSAMTQTDESRRTTQHIDQFLQQIDSAKAGPANTLLQNLFTSLANVEFTMTCYSNKFNLIGHVINNCQLGTATLNELFDQGNKLFPANSEECKTRSGLTYTSNEDVSSIVQRAAQVKGFNVKCPLNKPEIKDLVCIKKKDGISDQRIATDLKISESDVVSIARKCSKELTPREITIVCNLKTSTNLSDKEIARNLKLDVKAVSNVSC